MKNQYFGDISHYKEIGIIKTLSNKGKVKSLICWMLTPDDNSNDGCNTKYLKDPLKWRKHDPKTYDFLNNHFLNNRPKKLSYLEKAQILRNTDYYSTLLEDDLKQREKYFKKLYKKIKSRDYDLLFFEIDNGIEIKSVKKGNKNSSKYLYWDEISKSYNTGCSILVYQHFTREKREKFIRRKCKCFFEKLNCKEIYVIRTSRFIAFLLTQGDLISKTGNFVQRFEMNWKHLIEVELHKPIGVKKLTKPNQISFLKQQ